MKCFRVPTYAQAVSILELAARAGARKPHSGPSNSLGQFLSKQSTETCLFIVEASSVLYFQFRAATTRQDLFLACCSFYHSVTGVSLSGSFSRFINELVSELAEVEYPRFFQSDNGMSWLDILDGLHRNTHRVIKSVLGSKIVKVFNHVIAHALYNKMGIDVDLGFFGSLESKVIRPTIWSVASFVDAIIGLIIFLCKAGRQAILTRSIEPFFCDDDTMTQWLDKACALRKDSEFLNNPSVLGTSLPSLINDIKSCISDGDKLLKIFKKGREHSVILNINLELGVVLKRHEASLMACSFRRAPIGIFIYGGSSIGKSTISAGLFNHYCSVRGIDKETAVLWTRTENDDYYSGYKSHFAGVLHDDAAKYRPAKVQGIDKSFADIISEINNVQFVTPQAELNDKGKIPFRSEWVGVSSNVEDLTAGLYFNCPAAFFRRFAVRITPTVKEQYKVPGEDKIDTRHFVEGEQYPDYWHFKVDVPVVNGNDGKFVTVHNFDHYHELLAYMTGVYEKHIEQQTSLMRTVASIGPEQLCDCRVPKSICVCERPSKILSDEGMLFGSQAHFDGCNTSHYLRVARIKKLFKDVRGEIGEERLLVRCYKKHLTDGDYTQLLSPDYCDGRTDDEVLAAVEKHLRACVEQLKAMEPRERVNFLSDDLFNDIDNDEEFLSFEPAPCGNGFYISEQLLALRTQILKFAPHITDKDTALLDVYLHEYAPRYISEGWPVGDIIQGAVDYIRYYGPRMKKDTERDEVRSFLLDDTPKKWYEGLGIWYAKLYFSSPFVNSFTNAFISLPGVSSFILWMYSRGSSPRNLLVNGARTYDLRLYGAHPLVRGLLAILVTLGGLMLIKRIYDRFMPARARAVRDEECDTASWYGNNPDSTTETEQPTQTKHAGQAIINRILTWRSEELDGPLELEVVNPQMDLNGQGRLPVKRAGDKANVWTVTERAITALDVDPRRPHSEDQLCAAVKHNVVYCEVVGKFPQGMGMSRTRALVIDSETIVINNHALPVGSEVTIWVGPKTQDGPQPVVRINPDEQYVRRYVDRDLAIINTMGLPHRFKDIKHMVARSTYSAVGASALITKQPNGSIVRNTIIGVHLATLRGMHGAEDVDCRAWAGRPMTPTVTGDCGSPLVIQNALGCVIVGIHAGFHHQTQTAFSVRICREDFDDRKMPEIGVTKIAYPLAQAQIVKLGPNDKLYTDYHKSGTIMTHGQVRTFVARPKFTGKHTPHASYVFSRGHEFTPPIVDNMAAPRNCGWQQPQSVLQNYLFPTHSIKESAFRACAKAYVEYVAKHMTEEDWLDMHPVPIDVAVNGYPGVPNMDAQKHTTSAGHGRRGPKLRYMTEQENVGVWSTYRAYDESVLNEIDEMRENLAKGIRPHAIYDSCFKDELLGKHKVEAGRARAIYMCPVAFLVNMRMTTMGMCRVMIRRRQVFGMAVGLNTHSEEWNDAFLHCQELPGNNWIASDFQAFEAVLNLLISNNVSYVFVELAKRSGQFDDEQIMIFRTLLADVCNATINFFGELITLLGGEASGQQLTTFFNCIANNLLHMYAFVIIQVGVHGTEDEYKESARSFFELVRRNTLGDDVYLKVHPDCPEYNHTSIQEVFSSIGITYTMADKQAESRPYVGFEEVTFLKRSFVEHESFPGMKVAALDRKSIYKMLCYTVPSKTASEEEQMAAAMCSAVAEAFFHGRDFYNSIVSLIEDLPKSEELKYRMSEFPLPTWNTMINRFVNSSPKLKAEYLVPPMEESAHPTRSYCLWSELELQTYWRVDAWGSTEVVHSPRGIYRRLPWPNNVPSRCRFETCDVDENNGFSKNYKKQDKHNQPQQRAREMTPAVVEKVINKLHTKRRSNQRREKWELAKVQSEIVLDKPLDVAMQQHEDVTQQNTQFVNEPEGVKLTFGDNLDGLASSMSMPQDLGNYLSRPRLIATYTWAENTGSGFKTAIYPWQAYFAHPSMVDKLRGYSLLRAKLHVKLLINGSPFYYGSLAAVYTPLDGWRTDTGESTNVGLKLITSSQKPHVWLDNQNCSTAQMELPFIFPYPYLDITSSSNLRSMGKLELVQYAPLLSANGVSGNNIDVQVYAWAEDVQLTGPTNMPIAQSEFVGDTQLSTVASNVAAVAGKLDKVPIIGPYAKATEMAASAVGSVANFFGFTNVPNVSDVAPMKPMVFQLASTELSEPTQKLSLQTKQETCIGQQLHGGEAEDELVIQRFCSRSSYLCSSIWSTSGSPGDSLFACPVMPQLYGRTDDRIAYTPLGWAANHFQYWRGPMKFTFRVVRSPFHRGRIQISWDSRTGVLNQGPVLGNPNTLTKVMDLDGEDEVSFVVPYMQPELFQNTAVQLSTSTIPQPLYSVDASPPATAIPDCNGIINVRVLNRLTAPEASSDVTLLVFVSAAEGFELAGPLTFDIATGTSSTNWHTIGSSLTATVQSEIVYNDESPTECIVGDGSTDLLYKQVMGERLTSLRELLHRSSLAYQYCAREFNADVVQGTGQINVPIKRLPPPPGVVPNGWSTGTTTAGANQRCFYTLFHPLLSIGSCFLGYKGSVNVTLNIDQTRASGPVDTMQVRRLPRGRLLGHQFRRPRLTMLSNESIPANASARDDNGSLLSGLEGMALTNTRTNAGLSVQLPYYSAASFQLMDVLSEYSNTDLLTDRNNDWWQAEWRVNKNTSTGWFVGNNLQTYYASGPDFDLFFFINVPILTRIQITD